VFITRVAVVVQCMAQITLLVLAVPVVVVMELFAPVQA
jgi:hypothetical protein